MDKKKCLCPKCGGLGKDQLFGTTCNVCMGLGYVYLPVR
jgi:DnaJ-class molecular chaperone